MTEETENLILEILKKIQAEQAESHRDIREIKVRLTLMDGALAAIRSETANLYGLYAHQSSRIDRIEDRLEHIEVGWSCGMRCRGLSEGGKFIQPPALKR